MTILFITLMYLVVLLDLHYLIVHGPAIRQDLLFIKPYLSFQFLLTFGLAWMITNGWSYVCLAIGTTLHINWLSWVSGSYLAFLYMPFTIEKPITLAIAVWLKKKLFKAKAK